MSLICANPLVSVEKIQDALSIVFNRVQIPIARIEKFWIISDESIVLRLQNVYYAADIKLLLETKENVEKVAGILIEQTQAKFSLNLKSIEPEPNSLLFNFETAQSAEEFHDYYTSHYFSNYDRQLEGTRCKILSKNEEVQTAGFRDTLRRLSRRVSNETIQALLFKSGNNQLFNSISNENYKSWRAETIEEFTSAPSDYIVRSYLATSMEFYRTEDGSNKPCFPDEPLMWVEMGAYLEENPNIFIKNNWENFQTALEELNLKLNEAESISKALTATRDIVQNFDQFTIEQILITMKDFEGAVDANSEFVEILEGSLKIKIKE
jgi:hypothetical protein